MAKCYKLNYINKIMLFFEFKKGGFQPETPLWVRHWTAVKKVKKFFRKALASCVPSNFMSNRQVPSFSLKQLYPKLYNVIYVS